MLLALALLLVPTVPQATPRIGSIERLGRFGGGT
jgi:hypothetical protein